MPKAGVPLTIKVGVHVYTVVLATKREMPKGDDDDHMLGWCDYNNNIIWVYKHQPVSKRKEVLLHEVLHACGYPALSHKQLDEEDFVDATAPVLLQVLQDNPELVDYLRK